MFQTKFLVKSKCTIYFQ